MRTGLSLLSALALAAALVAGAQAYTYVDSDSVPEPWCGWWWPMYHPAGVDSCAYCPHLWQGGRYPGPASFSSIRPIYDCDTRYFWRPASIRDSGQIWENSNHHYTDESLRSCGHCGGMSNAQAMEPAPPADCGALSQDDLEGLLAEMDIAVTKNPWFPDTLHTPGTLWHSLQGSFRVTRRALVVNFYSTPGGAESNIAWYWPVHWYEVLYDTRIQGGETIADGRMYLHYEDHVYRADRACSTAMYSFWGVVMDSGVYPRPKTGAWGQIRTPPCSLDCPPGLGYTPVARIVDTSGRSNPYVNRHYDTIKRVIDYKTIIYDDAFPVDRWLPVPPPGADWVQRPVGYGGSCWSAPTEQQTAHVVDWSTSYPPGGKLVPAGTWKFFAWKPQPYGGDQLTDDAMIEANWDGDKCQHYRQDVSPYEQWVLVTTRVFDDVPWIVLGQYNCWKAGSYRTYFDAYKLDWVGSGLDGGASAAAVALGSDVTHAQVAPNPVRRTALIRYVALKPGPVEVVAYDVMGRAVLRAMQDIKRAGAQTARISVAGFPAGTYMARVNAAGVHNTCRFVVCR